jgi:small conductance mechanosensitive channel
MPETTAEIISLLTVYGLRILGAALMLIFGYMLAGWLARMVGSLCQRSGKLDPGVRLVLCKIVRGTVIVFTIISVLRQFGFETASLVALIGAAGLAIGLSLQGTLSNVAAGVMILSFRPFKVGDLIEADGMLVAVDEIGFFITRGHIPDGPSVVLPNSKIWGNTITNLSVTFNDQRRINETFGISYSDDMGQAIDLVQEILRADPRVLEDPPFRVAIGQLNDSSVDILVHAWTQRADWFPTKLDLNRRIKEVFDQNGITIPFPQRDVHLLQQAVTNTTSDVVSLPIDPTR